MHNHDITMPKQCYGNPDNVYAMMTTVVLRHQIAFMDKSLSLIARNSFCTLMSICLSFNLQQSNTDYCPTPYVAQWWKFQQCHLSHRYKKQYAGETQNPLHIHLDGYHCDIQNNKTEKSVAAHFKIPGHSLSDLTILVTEKVKKLGPYCKWLRT